MISLGIAVGESSLDLVVINDKRVVTAAWPGVDIAELDDLVDALQPDIVAIDSAPAPPEGDRRETETFSASLGILLEEARQATGAASGRLRLGHEVFESVAAAYPRFGGGCFESVAIEVAAAASAVVLAGALPPAGADERRWRRSVLEAQGVDTDRLDSPRQVDAALAALTGLFALEGRACWRGDPAAGVIILPCRESDLPRAVG